MDLNFKLNEKSLVTLLLVIIILSGLSLFFQVTNLQTVDTNSVALLKTNSQLEIKERPILEPSPPAHQRYEIIDIGSIVDPTYVEGKAINESGWVVGDSGDQNGFPRPILFRNGHLQVLGLPSPTLLRGWARDINDNGVIVGSVEGPGGEKPVWWDSNFVPHVIDIGPSNFGEASAVNNLGQIVGSRTQGVRRAMMWQNGQATELGTLGGNVSYAYDINDGGKIVGSSSLVTNGSNYHAFLWEGGIMSDLGTLPDGSGSTASAINESNEIVGFSFTPHHSLPGPKGSSVKRAVMWRDGEIIDLGSLPEYGDFSYALGVNDRGWVVGSSGWGNQRATLWRDGAIIDLNSYLPGNTDWLLVEAKEINNRNEITGYGLRQSYGNSATRGFLLRPVE